MKRWKAAATITFFVAAETRDEANAIAVNLAMDMEPDRTIRYRGGGYQAIDVEVSQIPVVDS